VDLTRHAAKDVGDEPLLLARIAPTWIARDRAAGARSATDHGATHIVMDDGYQNPSLYKDRNILVIDALTGFGNGAVFPAGPLREPVTEALSRADVIVVLGEGDWKSCLPEDHGLPLLRGHVIPNMPDMLNPREICVAFAGIAYPEKFYKSMELLGLTLAHKVSYPDHYDYREKDLETLRKLAQEAKAVLVTTYKDWIRLPGKQQEDIIPLPVSLKWEDDPTVLEILLGRDEK
jgi:tetraacyldisaccharide 4'-kinase